MFFPMKSPFVIEISTDYETWAYDVKTSQQYNET